MMKVTLGMTIGELRDWVRDLQRPRPLQPDTGPPGNPEATPECNAHSGPCNTYRQHRDLAGEFMVSAVEIGGDPFSYHYTNGMP